MKPEEDAVQSLRDFYFSAGRSYMLHRAKQQQKQQQQARCQTAEPSHVRSEVSGDSDRPHTAPPVDHPVQPAARPAGSGAAAAKRIETSTGVEKMPVEMESLIRFHQQRDELDTCHTQLQQVINALDHRRRIHMDDTLKLQRQAEELLGEMVSASFAVSKDVYKLEDLLKDASLGLHPDQLSCAGTQPVYVGVTCVREKLEELQRAFAETPAAAMSKAPLRHCTETVARVEEQIARSQLADTTDISRIPNVALAMVEELLQPCVASDEAADHSTAVGVLESKIRAAEAVRRKALDDGEMQIAERECFAMADYYETMQESLVAQADALRRSAKDACAMEAVLEKQMLRSMEDVQTLVTRQDKMKERCEEDITRVGTFCRAMEEKEQVLLDDAEGRRRSEMLQENQQAIAECWREVEASLLRLKELEADRYRMITEEVEAKERRERQIANMKLFKEVCSRHQRTLSLTISNCDTFAEAARLMGSVAKGCLGYVKSFIQDKREKEDRMSLAMHLKHLTACGGLYGILSDIAYRKERQLHNTLRAVQASHINLELSIDVLDPKAKKHSDEKKDLLELRRVQEAEVKHLKKRMTQALKRFEPSAEALEAAGVDFKHPLHEVKDQLIETRERMLAYKEMLLTGDTELPLVKAGEMVSSPPKLPQGV